MKYFVTLHGESIELELGATAEGRTPARLHRRGDAAAGGAAAGGASSGSGAASASDHLLHLRPIDGLDHLAVELDGRCHDVLFGRDARGMHVTVDGQRFECAVEDERERAAHLAAASGPKGPVTVRAPMPGILRAVLVKAGDAVKAGQPLVILEAMKMENELRADHAGVVREVKVAAGTAVDGGAALLVVEPPNEG